MISSRSDAAVRDRLLAKASEAGVLDSLRAEHGELMEALAEWDGHYRTDSRGALAFQSVLFPLVKHYYARRYGEAAALNGLGLALRYMRRDDEAITAHQDAATIHRELDDRYGEALALNNLGLALRDARRYDEAAVAARAAVQISAEVSDRDGEQLASLSLGSILHANDRSEDR